MLFLSFLCMANYLAKGAATRFSFLKYNTYYGL